MAETYRLKAIQEMMSDAWTNETGKWNMEGLKVHVVREDEQRKGMAA